MRSVLVVAMAAALGLGAGCTSAGMRAGRSIDGAQGSASRAPAGASSCLAGTYQLDDGSRVDIGPTDGSRLRWRRADGTSGALGPAPPGRPIPTTTSSSPTTPSPRPGKRGG